MLESMTGSSIWISSRSSTTRSRARVESGRSSHRPAVDPPLRGAVAESAATTGGRHPRQRDRGTPQGSAISPLLANSFLHYALDMWLVRQFPDVPFERYADDEILHCKTRQQAQIVLDAIIERLAQVGLELNPDKTRIVYCKDANRSGSHEHEQFDFLGYTFRPRVALGRGGEMFVSFSPAISNDAAKAIRATIRRWRLHLRGNETLEGLARIDQPDRAWLDQLLRPLLPDRADPLARSHQRVSDAMGHAEIQAPASPSATGVGSRGSRSQATARALRPLDNEHASGWMTGAG